jgi:hypothetical protein
LLRIGPGVASAHVSLALTWSPMRCRGNSFAAFAASSASAVAAGARGAALRL